MTKTALKSVPLGILKSYNPSRGFELLGEVDISTDQEIQDKVNASRNAQSAWGSLPIVERVEYMRKLLDLFRSNREILIEKTSEEMGMPLRLATSVTDGGLDEFQWNCDNAVKALSNQILFEDDTEVNELTFEACGVMACVLPWNFPFPNFARSPAMALLAGNTVVIKYSEEIALFAKFLEQVIEQSDLPPNIVQFVHGDGAVGDVLTDQAIDYISFTGSSKTGQYLYKKAAEKLIPVELELGGSSPGIVFADADLNDDVVETIWQRRFANSGQFCSGLKRLIVHNDKIRELTEKLLKLAKTKVIGTIGCG
jgi:lactaldehyde dehydrogenase/glycolaldehyde dehydrogenase